MQKGGKTSKVRSPEPTSAEDSPKVQELRDEITAADTEHLRLLNADSDDYAHLRRMHLVAERAWTLRATLYAERAEHDAARKASATANEHAAMAHKLEQNSAMDRLAELEKLLDTSRRDASRLSKMK